jgi:hypothetical protein
MVGPNTLTELDTNVVDLEARPVVPVLHRGHFRTGPALSEQELAEADYTVLAPSRPGYGHTPTSTGTSVAGITDVVHELCGHTGTDTRHRPV